MPRLRKIAFAFTSSAFSSTTISAFTSAVATVFAALLYLLAFTGLPTTILTLPSVQKALYTKTHASCSMEIAAGPVCQCMKEGMGHCCCRHTHDEHGRILSGEEAPVSESGCARMSSCGGEKPAQIAVPKVFEHIPAFAIAQPWTLPLVRNFAPLGIKPIMPFLNPPEKIPIPFFV